jgi:hypothetical protein
VDTPIVGFIALEPDRQNTTSVELVNGCLDVLNREIQHGVRGRHVVGLRVEQDLLIFGEVEPHGSRLFGCRRHLQAEFAVGS